MKDTIISLIEEAKAAIKMYKQAQFVKWLGKRQEPIKHWVVFEE